MTLLVYLNWLVICFAVAALLMTVWSWLAHMSQPRGQRGHLLEGGVRQAVILSALIIIALVNFGSFDTLITLAADIAMILVGLAVFRSALWALDLGGDGR